MQSPYLRFTLLLIAGVLVYQAAVLPVLNRFHFFRGESTQNTAHTPQHLYGIPLDSTQVVQAVVQSNENLAGILSRYNVSMPTVQRLSEMAAGIFDFRKLRVNQPYTVIHEQDSAQTARALIYYVDPVRYVVMHLGDSLAVQAGSHPVDTVRQEISGIITSSLYVAMTSAGGSPGLVSALAQIMESEVDFFEIQTGDWFKVIYEQYCVQGETVGTGTILAASMYHGGKERVALGWHNGEGYKYYDAQGNSLRRAFLKAPLDYVRISSHFSHSRLHPILKIYRPHHGVDYAAPIGTPVYTVADGTITKAHYSGGAGHMVEVRHNGTYTTQYLHLSRYGADIRPGTRVIQGQVIGYVGSSGHSTGPHLDFRFFHNGVPVNPLTVDTGAAEPLKPEQLPVFMAETAGLKARLDLIQVPQVSDLAYAN
ncbi:MAG: peptidoglycan DD-metalloendopeptidase family protein [Bacteroidia bacterium]|nr:peptidoglycan DD-metalloendopeptidase family protein [Bacteroidia bacterium]